MNQLPFSAYDFFGCLSVGAAIAEQRPVRSLLLDLWSGAPIVVSIIPFGKICVDLHRFTPSRQFARPACSLRWTGEYKHGFDICQTFLQTRRFILSMCR